jgi:hypothetical protein
MLPRQANHLPLNEMKKIAEHLIGRLAVCELVVCKAENAISLWR